MKLDASVIEISGEGLVSFKIDERLFAIPIGLVREINRHLELTRVHRAPFCIRGLVNLRGQIVTVMDLGERLGFGRREIQPASRLVVLKENDALRAQLPQGVGTDDATIGLLVDEISDVLNPGEEDLEAPPPHLEAAERKFLLSVCKTQGSTVSVLNPAALFESIEGTPELSQEALGASLGTYGSIEGRTHA